MSAGFSAVLRHVSEFPIAKSSAEAFDRVLSGRRTPLPAAIDAERREIQTSDAGVISYYADTKASGRPLVLLHGIHAAASAFEMRPLFESFRGQRPVYALDLPGFGFSERSARSYGPATYVHAIEHLLRNVAMTEGADVIAHSLTSEYAAKVAHEMPELVRSLVLISPTGFAEKREMRALERRGRKAGRQIASSVGELPPSRLLYGLLVSKPSLRYFLGRTSEQEVDPALLSYSYATSHQPGAHRAPLTFLFGELFPHGDALKVYGHVQAPTLVLYDRAPYTRFGALEAFAASHPHFAIRRLEQTRGLPQFDAPQQTVDTMRAFFTDIDGRSDAGAGMNGTRFLGSA